MKRQQIWAEVEKELRKDKKNNTQWPDHVCAQGAVVSTQSGILLSACHELKYVRALDAVVQEVQHERVEKEAIITIVKAIRFLEKLKEKS